MPELECRVLVVKRGHMNVRRPSRLKGLKPLRRRGSAEQVLPFVVGMKSQWTWTCWLIRQTRSFQGQDECHIQTVELKSAATPPVCGASLSLCGSGTIHYKRHPALDVLRDSSLINSLIFCFVSERWTLMANCVSLYKVKCCIKKKTEASVSERQIRF